MNYPVFDHNGMTIDGESGKDVLLKAYKADVKAAQEESAAWRRQVTEMRDDLIECDIQYLACRGSLAHYKRRCDELRKNNWRLGKGRDRLNEENIKLREKVIPAVIAVSLVVGAAWSWSLPFIYHFVFGK